MNLQVYKKTLLFSNNSTVDNYYICTSYRKESTIKRFKFFGQFNIKGNIIALFIEEEVRRKLNIMWPIKYTIRYNTCTSTYIKVCGDSITNLIALFEESEDNTIKNILIMCLYSI